MSNLSSNAQSASYRRGKPMCLPTRHRRVIPAFDPESRINFLDASQILDSRLRGNDNAGGFYFK